MNSDLANAYPSLRYLFGAYLNQDYDIDGPTLGDAVRTLRDEEQPAVVHALQSDISRFLGEFGDDAAADKALDAIDRDRAHPAGLSGRDYLLWIGTVLAEAARHHAAE